MKRLGIYMSEKENRLRVCFCLCLHLFFLLLSFVVGEEIIGGFLADGSCLFWSREPAGADFKLCESRRALAVMAGLLSFHERRSWHVEKGLIDHVLSGPFRDAFMRTSVTHFDQIFHDLWTGMSKIWFAACLCTRSRRVTYMA